MAMGEYDPRLWNDAYYGQTRGYVCKCGTYVPDGSYHACSQQSYYWEVLPKNGTITVKSTQPIICWYPCNHCGRWLMLTEACTCHVRAPYDGLYIEDD